MNEQDPDVNMLREILEPPVEVFPSTMHTRLRDETSRLVRARGRRRTIARLASFAACYLVGVATARLWFFETSSQHPGANEMPAGRTMIAAVPDEKVPAVTVELPPREEKESLDDAPPYVIEVRLSGKEPAERIRLLRLAGDKYLEASDVAAATRCYSEVAQWDVEHAVDLSVDDTWLLKALKQSKYRRNEYVHDAWQDSPVER